MIDMPLAGKGVFGPPRDRAGAVAVLRAAVASGVRHIDTSDFYGPRITNQIIREALHPYEDDLVIVSKVSARRGADGSWIQALSRPELTQAVHDNLRNLGLERLEVVNLCSMLGIHGPAEGSLEEPLTALAEVAHALGATPMQVALAWLLQRAPNLLLIPGTSSPEHLRENLASVDLRLPAEALAALDGIAAGACSIGSQSKSNSESHS